jgi:acetoin:2,6-dichlorophenolindophenol oxidoreductase subunit beta
MQGAKGLYEEFGPERILEAPISESAMVGAAIGAALFGRRPIVEISFGEFLPAAMNQLINQAPNIRYMTGGAARVPVVVRTRVGDGAIRRITQHGSRTCRASRLSCPRARTMPRES